MIAARSCLQEMTIADLRKKAPRTMKAMKPTILAEWEGQASLVTANASARNLKLRKTAVALRHIRSSVAYTRDQEKIVSKRAIYGKCVKLNQANYLRHCMKQARYAVLAHSGIQTRKERLWNNKRQSLASLFQLSKISEAMCETCVRTSSRQARTGTNGYALENSDSIVSRDACGAE